MKQGKTFVGPLYLCLKTYEVYLTYLLMRVNITLLIWVSYTSLFHMCYLAGTEVRKPKTKCKGISYLVAAD